MVARLEREIGARLVQRTRPWVGLTPQGEILFEATTGAIAQIRSGIDRIQAFTGARPLVLNTTIGFASCYLMTRLNAFREAHGDIDIALVSRDLNDTLRADAADVMIGFDLPMARTGRASSPAPGSTWPRPGSGNAIGDWVARPERPERPHQASI